MRSTICLLPGLALLAGIAAAPAPVRAETYHTCTGFIDSLPATINTQGTWCLRHDLSTSIASGSAITVATNNVTIDCNDFKIGGLAAGADTLANGIVANNRFNVTVRHCNVRGFLVGIRTLGGGGHLIERNRVDANTLNGMRVAVGPGSTVRGNLVVDTGGAGPGVLAGEATGIYAGHGVHIIDNTISGVAPTPESGSATAYGIYTETNGDGTVIENRIQGLAAAGAGSAHGIWNNNSGRTFVSSNKLKGDGATNSVGVRCTNIQATAHDNAIAGFATGVLNCLSSSNIVNPN
ncbi:right-handed parallel beta-helix repeat-containing protein [Luteimonas salinilitoris]|uniref:Right-handed parallel beta-helix repeat-containing protein n=1 Tax=Luteimonas salinilitoris TaxID=3237697 RepID=A0ABV4HUF3_9GAMM